MLFLSVAMDLRTVHSFLLFSHAGFMFFHWGNCVLYIFVSYGSVRVCPFLCTVGVKSTHTVDSVSHVSVLSHTILLNSYGSGGQRAEHVLPDCDSLSLQGDFGQVRSVSFLR